MDPLVSDLSLMGQVAAALLLLFLPTALMGMTLPLLVGHFIARSANVGLSTGSLYYANTMGAVVGCLVATFALFPWLGCSIGVDRGGRQPGHWRLRTCRLSCRGKRRAEPACEPQPAAEPAGPRS